MTVLVTMDVPFSREAIEALSAQIGSQENPPAGLLVHVITEQPEGCHVTDVWESVEDFRAFEQNQLGPAIAQFLASSGREMPDEPPAPQISEAYDLVVGRS